MTIKIGNQGFIQDQSIDLSSSMQLVEKLQGAGKTTVLVSVNNSVIGIIGLLDTPKPGAKEAISALKSLGIESVMLTGDNENTAQEIAHSVGIERVFANVLPSGKVDVVTKIQKERKQQSDNRNKKVAVAMIGDGINDAPALTAADIGIAIGSGTDVAIEAGKVVLVRDDIHDVVTAIEIARKTVSKIKQNLIYAFMYNVILIPVGATGLLYPAFAGIAMAASSVSVTMSSLTLKRWSERRGVGISENNIKKDTYGSVQEKYPRRHLITDHGMLCIIQLLPCPALFHFLIKLLCSTNLLNLPLESFIVRAHGIFDAWYMTPYLCMFHRRIGIL